MQNNPHQGPIIRTPIPHTDTSQLRAESCPFQATAEDELRAGAYHRIGYNPHHPAGPHIIVNCPDGTLSKISLAVPLEKLSADEFAKEFPDNGTGIAPRAGLISLWEQVNRQTYQEPSTD